MIINSNFAFVFLGDANQPYRAEECSNSAIYLNTHPEILVAGKLYEYFGFCATFSLPQNDNYADFERLLAMSQNYNCTGFVQVLAVH